MDIQNEKHDNKKACISLKLKNSADIATIKKTSVGRKSENIRLDINSFLDMDTRKISPTLHGIKHGIEKNGTTEPRNTLCDAQYPRAKHLEQRLPALR